MSEPMSTHEIEDVLSSIRRLVSEDLRPSVGRPPEGQAQAGVAEKLMLTPALRVVAATDAPVPTGDEAAWRARSFDAAAPVGVSAVAPVEEVVARLGASVPEEEWESPFGDPEIWAGRDAPPATDTTAVTAPGFVARSRMTLDAAESEFEAESETEAEAEEVPAGFRAAPMSGFADAGDAEPEVMPGLSSGDEPATAPRRVLRREIAPPQDDGDWADAAEAAVRADLEQGTEDEVIAELYDSQADGMAFDEEVLRDLVRDLIREELAGALGERITRNVRKLVRTEIARAMSLRDFE